MGGASKLLQLLCSPLPLLYPARPSAVRRLLLHSRLTGASLPFLPNRTFSSAYPYPLQLGGGASSQHQHFHTTTSVTIADNFHADPSPHAPIISEWSNLLDTIRLAGYFNNQSVSMQFIGDDALYALENLPQDFVRAASACLSFARHRPHLLLTLYRKDIEIIVQNGSPFLFKSSVDTTSRMRSFLNGTQNSELVFEGAALVDLMRFLLSYVYNSVVSDQNNLSSGELVQTSVCSLLRQLAYESRNIQEPAPSSMPSQFANGYGQASKPLRQDIEMKKGDWICPKCSFMNFARNMKCLECDETRPRRQLAGGEWDCPQCNFFNYSKNVVCLRCDCKRPGETSGSAAPSFGSEYNYENKADALNRTAPLEQRRANAYPGSFRNVGTPEPNYFDSIDGAGPGKSSDSAINQSLDRILGRSSEGSKSEHVPFKPLPSDMFNKSEQVMNGNSLNSGLSSDGLPLSRRPVNQPKSKEDEEQSEKSERWSKKVAELHDVTDLPSAISDEDFPEIMPMRKGENRFVVSKKRDRSLNSPLPKRRAGMEQTSGDTNFVPFVPFPPDYFSKKDKVPEAEASTGTDIQGVTEKFTEQKAEVLDSGPFTNSAQSPETQQSMEKGIDTSFSRNTYSESRVNYSYQSGGNSSWEENRSSPTSPITNFTQQSANSHNTTESWRGGFSGKSLEGSLVKEPDPLDMSEEAKAERWFRRAAQIKDISELSQIPDEDFPQIMPMRKGVNRFVVSKRKTPLERRLTSPQYRRNLPTVSSDPIKKDNTEG